LAWLVGVASCDPRRVQECEVYKSQALRQAKSMMGVIAGPSCQQGHAAQRAYTIGALFCAINTGIQVTAAGPSKGSNTTYHHPHPIVEGYERKLFSCSSPRLSAKTKGGRHHTAAAWLLLRVGILSQPYLGLLKHKPPDASGRRELAYVGQQALHGSRRGGVRVMGSRPCMQAGGRGGG